MNNILYGINTIKNLILYKRKYINIIFISSNIKNNNRLKKIKELIIKNKINFNILNNKLFKIKFYKLNIIHQGIIAFVKENFLNNKNTILDLININIINNKKVFFLILDNINSPYNLGSCIRTAVASKITGIIISKYNSVSIKNSIVHKVSTGSIYKIPIFIVPNLSKVINFLKKKKIYILGTCIKSKNSIYNNKYDYIYKSIALLLGSENKGIKKSLKKKCNLLINIPIFNISSLNVSVSYGIIMFEILRKKIKLNLI